MKSLKKLTLFLLAAALAATSLSLTAFADVEAEPVWGDVQQDNFVRVSSAEGFAAGTTQNLAVSEEIGRRRAGSDRGSGAGRLDLSGDHRPRL